MGAGTMQPLSQPSGMRMYACLSPTPHAHSHPPLSASLSVPHVHDSMQADTSSTCGNPALSCAGPWRCLVRGLAGSFWCFKPTQKGAFRGFKCISRNGLLVVSRAYYTRVFSVFQGHISQVSFQSYKVHLMVIHVSCVWCFMSPTGCSKWW